MLAPGQVLGARFRVERLLGSGGMGAVVAAEHLDLRQRVAVKLLRADLGRAPEALERFMREARASARLKSEHVAHVMDVGILHGSIPYMVMEYLDGCNLADYLGQRGPLPVATLTEFILQALDAIAEAHHEGIIHRDLKPSNLFLATAADGEPLVKVLDFGISKVPRDLGFVEHLTSAHASLGSPRYVSPEQARDPSSVDHRTDIWSIGVTLYELATGLAPFRAPSLPGLLTAIHRDTPPSPHDLCPEIPAAFATVVMRCLEKDPDRRYQDVAALGAALAPLATSPSAQWWLGRIVRVARPGELPRARKAPSAPRGEPVHPGPRRVVSWRWVGAGAAAGVVAWLGWWSSTRLPAVPATPSATPAACASCPLGVAPSASAVVSEAALPPKAEPAPTRSPAVPIARPFATVPSQPSSILPSFGARVIPRASASAVRAIDFHNPFAGPRRRIDEDNPFGQTHPSGK